MMDVSRINSVARRARTASILALLLGMAALFAGATQSSTITLSLTSGGNTVTQVAAGSVVTLTATVMAGTTPVTVGQVKFCNASAAYCTDIHLLNTAQLTKAGTAIYKFRPGVGSHSYKAVFVGTNNYMSSTSSLTALTVTGLYSSITAITATLSSGNPQMATVGGTGTTAPTGTVSFLDTSNGNAVLAEETLSSETTSLSFMNPWSIPTNDAVVATGDFNGDGILDFITYGATGLTVWLGNGNGTFTAGAVLPSSVANPPIAVGDFNGDGILDLVTNGANGLTVWLGNGDGTFTAGANLPSSVSNSPIAVGDFNGDGILDLVTSEASGLTVWLGNGDGTFNAQLSLVGGPVPTSIVTGELTGDGILDIVTSGASGLTVWLGNGDGTFTAGTSIPSSFLNSPIAVADFNGDGILDLAVPTNCCINTISIFLGNGDGTFKSGSTVSLGSVTGTAIQVGDFNGDGFPDLALIEDPLAGGLPPSNSVEVLVGDGQGNFQPGVYAEHNIGDATDFVAGDFLGDGLPDLITSFSTPANPGSIELFPAVTNTSIAFAPGSDLPVATGTHQIAASYSGDSNYGASVSGAISITAGQGTPTVSVTASPNPATYGASVTLAATVTGTGLTPTGIVTYYDGSQQLGTGLLNSSGVSTFATNAFVVGSNPITAVYAGDANYIPLTSSAINLAVTKTGTKTLTPIVTVTPTASSITTTQALTVTVAVIGGSGNPTPTGSVTLTSGSFTSMAVTLSGGSATINVRAGSLAVGSDMLTATYLPDSNSSQIYNTATGTSGTSSLVTVSQVAQTILFANPGTQTVGTPLTLSATSTSGLTVTFTSTTTGTCTVSGTTVTFIAAGPCTIDANQAGNTTYTAAAMVPQSFTVNNPLPLTSGITPAYASAGGAAFTLIVYGSGFTSGSTVYWGTSALVTTFGSATQLTAQVPAADITTGGITVAISVITPIPGGGTSNPFQFAVDSASGSTTGPQFSTVTQIVPAGSPASYPVTLPSTVVSTTVTCLNLPTGAACSYSATTNMVTITTSSTTPTGTYQVTVIFTETVAGAATSWILLPILSLPLVLLRRKLVARGVWITASMGLVLLAAAAYTTGCGGGGSTTPPPQTHQVVSSGTVGITIQ
jgi:hypothetical protein